jgi:hypothetical protein
MLIFNHQEELLYLLHLVQNQIYIFLISREANLGKIIVCCIFHLMDIVNLQNGKQSRNEANSVKTVI